MDTMEQFKMMRKTGGAVVVLGGGASGMAAAIRAKQQGAESVTILEAAAELGGNAVYAPVPSLKIPEDPAAEAHEDYLRKMEEAHWASDARIVRTLCDKIAELPKWLSEFSGDAAEGERGGKLARILADQCEKSGVIIRTNCRAVRIIQDEDGWTTGVEAALNGEVNIIPATVAVVATGGFLGNTEMLRKYIPYVDEGFESEAVYLGNAYSGEGVIAALELGAGDEGHVTLEWSPDRMPLCKLPLTESVRTVVNAGEAMWVNNVGVRYCNEGRIDSESAVIRQPNKDTFIVMDEGILETLAVKYSDKLDIGRFKKDIQPMIDADQVLICDNTGALAAWIRGKQHILQAAFERYEQCCEAGYDFLFGKDPEYLIPFGKGPFYVFRSGFPVVMTHGPVKVNPMMSCVTATDFPVRGVLACGGVIGGLYADRLISTQRADSLRSALASGLVAGEHAASYISGGRPAPKFEFPRFTARDVMAGNYYNVGTVPPSEGMEPPAK